MPGTGQLELLGFEQWTIEKDLAYPATAVFTGFLTVGTETGGSYAGIGNLAWNQVQSELIPIGATGIKQRISWDMAGEIRGMSLFDGLEPWLGGVETTLEVAVEYYAADHTLVSRERLWYGNSLDIEWSNFEQIIPIPGRTGIQSDSPLPDVVEMRLVIGGFYSNGWVAFDTVKVEEGCLQFCPVVPNDCSGCLAEELQWTTVFFDEFEGGNRWIEAEGGPETVLNIDFPASVIWRGEASGKVGGGLTFSNEALGSVMSDPIMVQEREKYGILLDMNSQIDPETSFGQFEIAFLFADEQGTILATVPLWQSSISEMSGLNAVETERIVAPDGAATVQIKVSANRVNGQLAIDNLVLLEGSGETQRVQRTNYLFGNGVIATRISGDDPPDGQTGLYYQHHDHLGSASLMSYGGGGSQLSASIGEKVPNSEQHFLPFGQLRTPSNQLINNQLDYLNQLLSATGVTDRGFTGHKENRDIGLTFMNARYYVSSIGRFASADTIIPDPGSSQAYNRYAYVENRPILFTDPSGHCGANETGDQWTSQDTSGMVNECIKLRNKLEVDYQLTIDGAWRLEEMKALSEALQWYTAWMHRVHPNMKLQLEIFTLVRRSELDQNQKKSGWGGCYVDVASYCESYDPDPSTINEIILHGRGFDVGEFRELLLHELSHAFLATTTNASAGEGDKIVTDLIKSQYGFKEATLFNGRIAKSPNDLTPYIRDFGISMLSMNALGEEHFADQLALAITNVNTGNFLSPTQNYVYNASRIRREDVSSSRSSTESRFDVPTYNTR